MEIRVSNLRPAHARAGSAKVVAEFDADIGPVRFRRMRLATQFNAGPTILMPDRVSGGCVSVLDAAAHDAVRREAVRLWKEQRP